MNEAAPRVVTAARSPLLALSSVVKRYDTVLAVAGVDLSVRDGEILTILGPSGSGKTTLLKMVAGFEQPDEGRITLGERDITDATPASRGIGMVFQNYALFPHLRVAENVAFPLEMRRMNQAQIKERVSKAPVIRTPQNTPSSPTAFDLEPNGAKQKTTVAQERETVAPRPATSGGSLSTSGALLEKKRARQKDEE